MKKESLVKELPVSEMVATLEKLAEFEIKPRHLKWLRTSDVIAERIADVLRSGGHQEYSESQQEAREIMCANMVGLKDWSVLGIEAPREIRDQMFRVPFLRETLEKYSESHILLADPGLGDSFFCNACIDMDIVKSKAGDPSSRMVDLSELADRGTLRWRLVKFSPDMRKRVWRVTEIAPDLETTVK